MGEGVVLWPGVVLHELAHAAMAVLLLIPITKFSVIPNFSAGYLGVVQVKPPRQYMPLRHSLLGIAPLFTGLAGTLAISYFIFSADMVSDGTILSTPEAMQIAIQRISEVENPWIWLYLLFAIGNSMFPSPPDRAQWGLLGLVFALILIALIYFGYQDLVFQPMIGFFNNISGYLMLAFAMTIVIDIAVLPLLWFIHTILDSLFG